MLNLPSKLAAREEPIRVGLVGAGLFGTKLADQLERAPGMELVAVADLVEDNALAAFEEAGTEAPVSVVETAAAAASTIEDGGRAVLDDGTELAETPVDVVVEATGVPDAGARHAYAAIQAGTHVVNVTVEADSVVGPILADLAESRGVTYSLAYGDQPALMVELCDWARTIGMDVVAAGRGSTYVEADRFGTPDDVFERFGFSEGFVADHGLNARMYNSFLDGTKIAVETCSLANAAGLSPDVPGMHHETLEPHEVPERLRPATDGGILGSRGVVEVVSSRYADGSTTSYDLGPGVFVVASTSNRGVQEYLAAHDGAGLHVASDGEYAFFHRPFHLPGVETPISVANAALRNEPTGAPGERRAEVVGAAKRDLEPGDELDGGGGYTVYGLLESAERVDGHDHVPFELLGGATVTSRVGRDEVLAYDDVDLPDTFIRRLREDPGAASL